MPDLDYRQKAWSAGLIVLFFVAWELFCLMTGMSDLVLPRPSQVFVRCSRNSRSCGRTSCRRWRRP
jgi:ABC-type nitrate/sulfonate/bicarbonate transport system permease component